MSHDIFSGKEKSSISQIAIAAVMAALVCVTTMLIQVPIPATEGFFNIGDAMIMVAALTFGPLVGGIAGGIGSSLADLIGGWYIYVIPTLFIKGVEGLLAGWISSRGDDRSFRKVLLAWIVGGFEMVLGYFTVQVFIKGFNAALVEVPFNLVQMAVGGIVGIPLSTAVRRYLPTLSR